MLWRRRRRRRPIYVDLHLSRISRRVLSVMVLLAGIAMIAAFLIEASIYLRELSRDMALSDAEDMITMTINSTISRKLADQDYGYDYFVILERDDSGDIAAVSANMSRINALSSELLQDVLNASENGLLNLDIPVGNLMGSSLLLGRGPTIPVEITMLTSSRVDLKNEIVSAGINQTKHQIKLDVVVDINVILPWETVSTKVESEVLVAETVVVGSVPDTYFNME